MLSRLRFASELSRGRRRPEPDHPYRGCYERDRDRVVHSRAFRRLEHKTQVFTEPFSDHFRNRLTHTIEVAQIGRTVARALGLNEDLVEALALAHDLGHPPFGHAGEEALDACMRAFGDEFDHNLHALRIVESLEQRYAAFDGLNLTFEVREGILKHSRDAPPIARPDLEEYDWSRRPTLEAQLIDPVDEIAYNCADLDDAFEARLIDFDDVAGTSPFLARSLDGARRRYPGAGRWAIFNEALRGLIDFLATGLIEGARRAAEQSGARDHDDVRGRPERLARMTPESAEVSRALKAMLHRRVYKSAELEREHRQSRRKVTELFEHYVGAPERLPRAGVERAEREAPHRAVCDYIAGMTDKFLLRRHAELFGVAPAERIHD